MALAELYSLVGVSDYLPGCPAIQQQSWLARMARRFCIETGIWQETLEPVTFTQGVKNYTLAVPAGYDATFARLAKLEIGPYWNFDINCVQFQKGDAQTHSVLGYVGYASAVSVEGAKVNYVYCNTTGTAAPLIEMRSDIATVEVNGVTYALGTLGALANHQYAFGNEDGLGFSTLYFRRDETGAVTSLNVTYSGTTGLLVFPYPWSNSTDTFKASVVFYPNETCHSYPDWLISQYFDGIKDGAIWRLKIMNNEPWSDAAGAKDFQDGWSRAKAEAQMAMMNGARLGQNFQNYDEIMRGFQ